MQKFLAINSVDSNTAEVLLYGYIGADAITAAGFIAELKKVEATHNNIHLRVNSGGGSIFEGLAIYNALKNSPCNITAYVDGLAASMATIIVLACKKVYMSRVAMLMAHRAKGQGLGTSEDLRRHADMLDELEITMSQLYAEKTGLAIEAVKAKYMNGADNWLSAEAALADGLIDGIYDAPAGATPLVANASSQYNEKELVTHFTNFLNTENTMSKISLSAAQLAVLNLEANASEEAAIAAITTLAAKAAKVDALEQDLATARAAITAADAERATAKINALVDGAVAALKITATEADTYKKLATADFETTKALLDAAKPYQSVESRMQAAGGTSNAELATLAAMSGRDLYMTGKLERLKLLSEPVFVEKFKEYFGQKPLKN